MEMKALRNSLAYCVKEKKPCVGWVDKYFKDCLCNLKDEFSFAFGLVSLTCWGVAEIPQIITNFRSKSSHGVSLLFLLTWVAGDIFNLVGCLLEPATLPTQLYTALLYTASTVVLVLQGLYYDHFYTWWKCRHAEKNLRIEDVKKPLKPSAPADSGIPIPVGTPKAKPQREYYYTSARSLARSSTPPTWSYLGTARSGPSAMELPGDSSSDDESIQSYSKKPITVPKSIPRSAGYGAFLGASVGLPPGSKAFKEGVYVGLSGRRLLQEHGMEESAYGQYLGWMMAAIYMGSRIPQIWLNIKRGNVEGLNPLMFVFAFIANATYVASIVVRTTERHKIKANMPWLLDAAVCVALDLFIILQYIYYRYIRSGGEAQGDYLEANKAP
ncbi:probable vacuolar amino acid transporter YPQ3 isoform X2 [Diospyros lotus]|uniref:probable vacuolar amino acid transporter YPQ3 isoform X2 n=1 Tax=Diospyros lotus TaxID=55363 RepID=UPI002252E9DE|nr:probable vacuolar amino acid transporter YPQ3 isoform X2 [Diospyros lotus]